MPVSRAPLATATSAIALNSTGGTIPAARTTCSSGALDPTEHDDECETAHLDDRRDAVDPQRLGDPPHVQCREQREEHGDHHGHGPGHEGAEIVACEAEGQRTDGDDARRQHAEAYEEADERAEREGRVVRGRPGAREAGRELGVGAGGQQRHEQRGDQRHPHGAAGDARDLPDQDVDPGAEDVAQDEQQQRARANAATQGASRRYRMARSAEGRGRARGSRACA